MLTPYDVVRYPSRPQAASHPAHLASIARLRGFESADIERCRVLELGCGEGRNLISLALAHPESRFVGIDLAETSIREGRRQAERLGLPNLRLLQGDLAEFRGHGEFDYVLAHGVYSWVPEHTRDALLGVCRESLAERGLVYVGYATYPGCHLRELVRDLMLFHTDRIVDPRARVQEGLACLEFLTRVQTAGPAYSALFAQERERLVTADPDYVLHDDFAEQHHPVYFGAFVQHAARHGLAFFAEALFSFFDDPRLSPETLATVQQLAGNDPIALEQYLDFVRVRAFRQSLLCHGERALPAGCELERIFTLHASSPLKPVGPAVRGSDARRTFRSADGAELSTQHASLQSALCQLGEAWPGSVPVAALWAPSDSTREGASEQRSAFARALLGAAALRAVELRVGPVRLVTHVSERPRASRLARLDAEDGASVTTLRHVRVRLEDIASRQLLRLLDGTRTRPELLEAMRAQLAPPAPADAAPLELLELEQTLVGIAQLGLLEA